MNNFIKIIILTCIIIIFIKVLLTILNFVINIEHFDIYKTSKCDQNYQPCMASQRWTYYNGYYYPMNI